MRHILAILFAVLFAVTAEAAEKTTFAAKIGPDGVQRVDILAGRYYFTPNHIILKVKVPAEVSIRKEPEIVPHSFVIQAPEAGMDIHESLSAEAKVVKFTPTRTGSYPFFCDRKLLFLPSHRQEGMEGTIEVTE